MTVVSLLFLILQSAPEDFSRFTYCRETPRGLYELQCLELNRDGAGRGRFKRRGSDEIELPLTLSDPGRRRFLAVLAATNYLADRASYETKRKVADLGKKRLVLELASGKREAEFNYSDLKEVNALATFFDALLNQQALVFDLETAARFERLSVPERLDLLENELKVGRIGDPEGLIPVLEKIAADSRVMDYAREHAQQMKSRLGTTR